MAHQTSKTSQKQSTPHSIGRLMDADFFGGHFSISRCISWMKRGGANWERSSEAKL